MYSWVWGSTDQKEKENQSLPEESHKKRYEEFLVVKKKYPELVPIIVTSKDIILTKPRYLTKKKITFKAFAEIVRQYCFAPTSTGKRPIDSHMPLLFIANDILVPPEDEMGKVYEIHKKNDGFLHISMLTEPDWMPPHIPELPPTIIENYGDVLQNQSRMRGVDDNDVSFNVSAIQNVCDGDISVSVQCSQTDEKK